MYGFRSYISAPIIMLDGTIWGTLCAIDPKPRQLERPEIVDTFQLFGELIAAQLELSQRFERTRSDLGLSEANFKASEANRLSVEASLKSARPICSTSGEHRSFASSSLACSVMTSAIRLHPLTPGCASYSELKTASGPLKSFR